MSKGRILFQLSGSIACFKACALLSKLVQAGFEVEVVATPSALKFVGEATLEGLTGKRVHSEVFAPGEYMNHIHLMRWADVIVLYPATANTINKLAQGIGDDLISTLFLAHDFKKPYLIAPAMNTSMLAHPATQSSISTLSKWGVEVLGSSAGSLACGEIGAGRLMEPEDMLGEIEARFTKKESGLRVLVTSGGTQEPIDGVRSLTNFSSGEMGSLIADRFSQRGHKVTLLHAKNAVVPKAQLALSSFVTFSDLKSNLEKELGQNDYDVVVHAAAVGDFALDQPLQGKIESDDSLTLKFKKNPKLVDRLREMSRNKNIRVVAFKLTNSEELAVRKSAVEKLAAHAHPDWIVHNDLHDSNGTKHFSRVLAGKNFEVLAEAQSKPELADALESLVAENFKVKQ